MTRLFFMYIFLLSVNTLILPFLGNSGYGIPKSTSWMTTAKLNLFLLLSSYSTGKSFALSFISMEDNQTIHWYENGNEDDKWS